MEVNFLENGPMRNECVLMLACVLTATVHAQTPINYMLDPSSATRAMWPLDKGDGITLYVSERMFGAGSIPDSTQVSLLTTAPDHSLIEEMAFRGNGPMSSVRGAHALGTGLLLCGSQAPTGGLTYPFLTHLTSTASVDWSLTLDGLSYFQNQVVAFIPSGTSFTAYTRCNGCLEAGSYRFSGDESGATWDGQVMMAPEDVRYAVMGATASLSDDHTLFGEMSLISVPDYYYLMVMHTTLEGATWMKRYDLLPTVFPHTDRPGALIHLSDGNMLLAGYITNFAGTEGCLLKLAPDGEVLWCRRYMDANGNFRMNAVVEMPDGSLMAAGTDSYSRIILLDLQSDGTLMSAKRYLAPTVSANYIQGFFRNAAGELKLITNDKVINISSEGSLCDFLIVFTVTSALHTPIVTEYLMSNAPFTPSTSALETYTRANDLSWIATCGLNAVEEHNSSVPPEAHPVPSDRIVHLGGPNGLDVQERVILWDVSGELRFDGAYGNGLDLAQLPAGLYVCEVPRLSWRVKVLRE